MTKKSHATKPAVSAPEAPKRLIPWYAFPIGKVPQASDRRL